MTAEDVLGVVGVLGEAEIHVWLDGGWGVDALLGRRHREHDDIDLVMDRAVVPAAAEVLADCGYAMAENDLPTRAVFLRHDGKQIDVHPVSFDANGTGWQAGGAPDGGDCVYPATGFTTGTVAGTAVPCLAAEVQLAHHLGYEPRPRDVEDMHRLAATFGIVLPAPYSDR